MDERLSRLRATGPIAVFVSFIGAWYAVSYLLLNPQQRFLLPPPHRVIAVGFADWENLRAVLEALLGTAIVALLGLAIAVVVGIAFGTLMFLARWLEDSFYPYAVVLQTVPVLAMIPLIGLWFGFNFNSRVLVCAVISLFPIITNTLFGLKSTPQSLRELFLLRRVGRVVRLVRLEYPYATPAILTGIRISAGISVIAAIVADFFFRQGSAGIGRLIDLYRAQIRTEELITALTFSSLLGVGIFYGVGYLSHRMVGHWHESHLGS
jgi:NitT/TauT family transport system permease protein